MTLFSIALVCMLLVIVSRHTVPTHAGVILTDSEQYEYFLGMIRDCIMPFTICVAGLACSTRPWGSEDHKPTPWEQMSELEKERRNLISIIEKTSDPTSIWDQTKEVGRSHLRKAREQVFGTATTQGDYTNWRKEKIEVLRCMAALCQGKDHIQ
jgi:hypothetical protein